MKRSYSFLNFAALILMMIAFSLPVSAQFITIARKIKSMRTPQADIATVMVESGATGVYRVIIDTLTGNRMFEITKRGDPKRYVEFTRQGSGYSLQVDSLAKNLTQITVACPAQSDGSSRTQPAVEAILRVCRIVGVTATVE